MSERNIDLLRLLRAAVLDLKFDDAKTHLRDLDTNVKDMLTTVCERPGYSANVHLTAVLGGLAVRSPANVVLDYVVNAIVTDIDRVTEELEEDLLDEEAEDEFEDDLGLDEEEDEEEDDLDEEEEDDLDEEEVP